VDQTQPVFFYDLGSPQCYLLAETIMARLPTVPEWEPVLGSDLAPAGRSRPNDGGPADWRAAFERQAAELGLQPFRWPPSWPPDTEAAMLAASYAKRIGRAVAFSLAAFRQTFAGGRDPGDEDTILIAGAACEMHPTALRKGIALASTKAALGAAGERARAAGVSQLPAIQVGRHVYCGPDALHHAAAALESAAR
jgi:2-hydroxychromene-2-carboxylate isomerase